MSEEISKQLKTIQLQISELKASIDTPRNEMREFSEGFENRIQSFENQVRDWTRPDPSLWAWGTFTIVTSNIYVALLVGSAPTHGFERMLMGMLAILFGVFFMQIRLAMGQHIQAPPRLIRAMQVFLVAIVITGIITIIQGLLQFLG